MNNKVAIAIGAIVAVFGLSILMRFVVLSQYGVPGSWMYFGLPFGGIGVLLLLLRLGLLNFGEKSAGTNAPWQHNGGVHVSSIPSGQPAASASHRLQQLDALRANGAISEAEYMTTRQQIISGV
ncbi:SHOCT domain-containing protein [Mycobacterium sp. MMS18-G62]